MTTKPQLGYWKKLKFCYQTTAIRQTLQSNEAGVIWCSHYLSQANLLANHTVKNLRG